jgi:NAD(P)-dependent dehydrogenase (short-subunit alcohol dehydrogenase family)
MGKLEGKIALITRGNSGIGLAWTTDLRDRRIRVNAVSPGSTETP